MSLTRYAHRFRVYLTLYRAPAFRSDEHNWATHDFLTRREMRALCRHGGFEDVCISGYWILFSRRILPDPRRRFRAERFLGAILGLRHFAAVLAVEARRSDRVVV